LKARVAWFRADLDIAPVLFHNPLDSVEAESGTFADSFCSEKGFENVRQYIGRNSRTIIGDLHYNALVVAIGSNSKLTLATHGGDGVVDQVGPNLI
jgi:hypothetical protein